MCDEPLTSAAAAAPARASENGNAINQRMVLPPIPGIRIRPTQQESGPRSQSRIFSEARSQRADSVSNDRELPPNVGALVSKARPLARRTRVVVHIVGCRQQILG